MEPVDAYLADGTIDAPAPPENVANSELYERDYDYIYEKPADLSEPNIDDAVCTLDNGTLEATSVPTTIANGRLYVRYLQRESLLQQLQSYLLQEQLHQL